MKTLSKIASIILLLITVGVNAQEGIKENIKIHFNNEFNLISFYMNVGGMDSLNFIFDTGFDVNVLDQTIAEKLGFDLSNTITEAQPGGEITYSWIENVEMSHKKHQLYEENFIAAPISQLGMIIGQPIHGIIGMEFMKKYVIELDYEKSTLSLSSLLSEYKLLGYDKIEVNCADNQPFIMASVTNIDGNKVPAKLKMDTGSLDGLGFYKNYLEDAPLINENTPVIYLKGVGVGGETSGIQFRLNEIQLASYQFQHIVVGGTLEAGGFEIREDAGTIGAELLMRFNWVLDFDNNSVYIKPNNFYNQEQEQDRSGMWVIEGENSEKIIYKIIAESPCASTSLEEGQVIESINNQAANELSLFEFIQLLKQKDGTQLNIKVKDSEENTVIILKTMI